MHQSTMATTTTTVYAVIALVTVLCSAAATADPDSSRIVISPEDVLVYQGQRFLLPCVAYLDSNSSADPSLSWSKNDTQLMTDSRIIVHSSIVSDVSGVRFVRGVLEVCGVLGADSGKYSCVLSMDGVETDTADFEITITQKDAPTQILVAPEDINLSSNQTIVLTCIAHGLPSPIISWSQNGHALSPSPPGGAETGTKIESHVTASGGVRLVHSRLVLCNVRGIASGGYSCVAENGLSTSNASFEVAVPGSLKLLSGPSSTSSARVGSTHSMSCDFHSFPRPYVTWSGVPLIAAGRFKVQETVERREGVEFVRSVLSISPVADYDGGEVACVGTNGEQLLKHSFQLQVVAPLQIVVSPGPTHTAISHAHTTLTLACIAHSSSHIHWTRNDLEISTDDDRMSVASELVTRGGRRFVRGVLEVCGVGVTDSGEYSCVASGGGETATATFNLCPVETTGILIAPSDVTIATGHTLSVGCVGYTTISNAHSTNLSWTMDGQPLGNSSKVTVLEHRQESRNVVLIRATLLVDCIEPENAARYRCHVTSIDNVVKSADFNIAVHTPPLIKDAPNSTHSIPNEGTISFVCLASGNPLPAITWYKDGSPLILINTPGFEITVTNVEGFGDLDRAVESVLIIQSVGADDAGYYGCKAVNTAGETMLTNHYHLILSPVVQTSGLDTSGGLGHGSYVGGIVGVLCFLAIIVVYLIIKPLREELFTPALINACVSVIALNLAYIVSYTITHTGTGCVFFAALFHYLFLVAMLALSNLVVFKALTVTGKRRLFAHVIAFSLNWGIPLLVVAISISPDITNYTPSDITHFCGPAQWPYWLGELLPLALLHLITWCVFLVTSLLSRTKSGFTEWAWHTASTGSTLFLFDVTWSVGLPSTQHTDTALHIVFLISSIIFGLVSLIFYCLAYRKARLEILKTFKLSPASSVAVQPATPATQLEAMFQDRAFSMSGIEAGRLVELQNKEVHSRENITSFADSIAKEDFDLSTDALSQEENGDVFPSGTETEDVGKSEDPITSFCEPSLEESNLDLAVAEPSANSDQPAEPEYMITNYEPTQPRYVTANGVDCIQDDDVFATEEDVRVQEKMPLSRALVLSTSSSEGGYRTGAGYRPLRQGSVTGPQIVRYALV